MKIKGELIRSLREARGWKQDRLAQEVTKIHGKPVSQQSINHYEIGKTNDPRFLADMCQVLGITLKQLRTGYGSVTGVAEDRADYNVGPKGLALTRDIQSGSISEESIALLSPIIERLKEG